MRRSIGGPVTTQCPTPPSLGQVHQCLAWESLQIDRAVSVHQHRPFHATWSTFKSLDPCIRAHEVLDHPGWRRIVFQCLHDVHEQHSQTAHQRQTGLVTGKPSRHPYRWPSQCVHAALVGTELRWRVHKQLDRLRRPEVDLAPLNFERSLKACSPTARGMSSASSLRMNASA